MDDEQGFLRYAAPGIGAMLLTFLAWGAAFPDKLMAAFDSGMPWKAVGFFAVSGGVGFVLAQLYFALPWSRPDHRRSVREYVTDSHYEEIDSSKRVPARNRRSHAQPIVHYAWQVEVASKKRFKALNEASRRYAARKASLGTTTVGAAVGLAVLLCVLAVGGAIWHEYMRVLVVLGVPLGLLWCRHSRLTCELQDVVYWGLSSARKTKDAKPGHGGVTS